MSRWGTILLLFLAIGAGVFLWVVEPRLRSTREEESMRESLLGLNPDAVRGIRIGVGDQAFELNLERDGWWIGPRPKDRASIVEVSGLLRAATSLQALDIVRPGELRDGLKLDDFGLSEPKSQIDFIGDGEETLYFGKEAAGAGRIYVRIGDAKDVYVVSDELQKLAARDPAEFRDRRLTAFVPDQVDRFVIRRGTGEIEVERGAKGWELVRPLRSAADGARVEEVLATVLGARIGEFVAEDSNDLSAYGLVEPRAEIVLTVEGEPRPLALRIGGDAPESAAGPSVIAQYTGRDSVYHLPAIVWEALQVTPDSLRDRHLLTLNPDTIDAIRFQRGEAAETIEREGDEWKDARGAVSAESVEGFVRALNDASVEEYLPLSPANLTASGLDAPQLQIFFDAWLSENTPEATAGRHPVLEIAVGKIAEGRAWLQVAGRPEICVISAALLESLPGAMEPLNISAP